MNHSSMGTTGFCIAHIYKNKWNNESFMSYELATLCN